MPFGPSDAPASFQRALDIIMSKYNRQTCRVYFDDIIAFSKTWEEHLDLRTAGVSMKLRKCSFFIDSIKYLGHIMRPGIIEADRAATATLRGILHLETFTELRSFLGLCNVYRRFIRRFTDKSAPLYKLIKGKPLSKEFQGL